MYRLPKEERELRASVEKGEWRALRPNEGTLRRYAGYARHTLQKNRRINIRLSQNDLDALQTRAVQEGIPYQTLVSSVLHKYVTGQLRAA